MPDGPPVPGIPSKTKIDDYKSIDTSSEVVQIEIRSDGAVIWIHDYLGRCICRVSEIKSLEVIDHRNDGSWKSKTWYKNAEEIKPDETNEPDLEE